MWLRPNRHQSVRVGQSESPRTHCPTGVPEGSVLGPLLFTCYISPISSIASSFDASIQQYADGTQIYIALTTADVTAHLTRLSSCLSVLHNWFCHNGLALNSSKSQSILFGTRQRLRNPYTSTIAGSQIPFSDNIKTLGVTLDANLTLNQHVSSLCKSMHFHSRALCHIREISLHGHHISYLVSSIPSRLCKFSPAWYMT